MKKSELLQVVIELQAISEKLYSMQLKLWREAVEHGKKEQKRDKAS